MTTTLTDPLTMLGGVPFLDDGFSSARLLAAVAAVRHVEAERRGLASGVRDTEVAAWLAPARAYMLRGEGSMPAAPLAATRKEMIKGVLGELAAVFPAWAPLLRLPVRFALLQPANGAISASSRAWPQHVLLAEEAFATATELREQLVHELSHQWLYLIQEVWALQTAGTRTAVLPSGTRDRSPAEVLGAAHVAAVLTRMYRADGEAWASRIADLALYGSGCLDLLGTLETDLTDAGLLFARRLKEAL